MAAGAVAAAVRTTLGSDVWPYHSMRTFELLGRSWVLGMCMLWVTAVRDLCLGAVWTRQPIGMG